MGNLRGTQQLMARRAAIASVLVIAASACGQSAPVAPQDLRSQRVARLEKIAAGCGLPAASLELVGADDVHFQPPPDSKYERVDCVLIALRKTDMPTKLGFVGNEAPAPEIRP
jgi:hypothetical protein